MSKLKNLKSLLAKKLAKNFAYLSIIFAFSFFSSLKAGDGNNDQIDHDLMEQAKKIVLENLLIDGHVDAPYQIYNHGTDISVMTENNYDYEKAKRGGFDAPIMSIYIPAKMEETGGAKSHADILIGLMDAVIANNPDKFTKSFSSKDVKRNFKKGNLTFIYGMENGAPMEGSIENLKYFYKKGIRYITLTHSKVNHISDSSYDDNKKWGGLSPFGKVLVKEMNNIGMLVDVSHISDDAFFDVMKISKTPVIASHSSLRHFTKDFERNMSDEMVKMLADNGGIIMINYGSSFITQAANDLRGAKDPAYKKFLAENKLSDDDDAKEKFEKKWISEYPFADVKDVADHIDHVKKLVGIDYIGLGSDYDGVGDTLPTKLKDASMTHNLVYELLKRGYTEEEIVKILSDNFLRVWEKVEKYARRN